MTLRFPAAVRVLRAALALAVSTLLAAAAFARTDDVQVEIPTEKVADGVPKMPGTRSESVVDTLHGVAVADPYRWLEDQQSPETRAWIDVQNRYTDSRLGAVPGRAAVVKRLTELTRVDTMSTPFERGGRFFYTSRKKGQELSVLCVRKGLAAKEDVLVDPHSLSPDRSVSASFVDVSDDGKLVAWGRRQGGEDEVVVSLLEVDTNVTLADVFPRARYSGFAITKDRKSIWYGRQTEKGPRVFHHALGTDPAKDAVVFGEGYGPGKIIGVGASENGRWLALTVSYGSSGKTEVWAKDLSKDGEVFPVVKGLDAQFFGEFGDDALYVRTDWKAPNGRILRIDPTNPAPAAWKEVVPEGPAAIQGLSLAGGKLFVRDLSDVVARVRIFDLSGKPLGTMALPGLGSVSSLSGQWASSEAFYSFSSFNVPNAIYHYDVAAGKASEWWHADVPLDASTLEVKQVFYRSKDGTKIPMFLVYRKGLALDGTAPALLTAYGGFKVSLTPQFSARAVVFAERGGVVAVPNLRGGGEYGEAWHRAGMLAKKQNVFDDFTAAAEWLVANRYGSPSRLSISGGSNGGLLVGAALTQRPELFRAVICQVPLLDMVRYDRFKVAKFWVPEYGTADDPEQFRILYAYSPYHHVKDGVRYPAVMFVTGDSDTRVDPLHARKMTALMQMQAASVPGARPILLHYDTKSGHSAGKPISQTIEDTADELQFLAWQLDMAPGT